MNSDLWIGLGICIGAPLMFACGWIACALLAKARAAFPPAAPPRSRSLTRHVQSPLLPQSKEDILRRQIAETINSQH